MRSNPVFCTYLAPGSWPKMSSATAIADLVKSADAMWVAFGSSLARKRIAEENNRIVTVLKDVPEEVAAVLVDAASGYRFEVSVGTPLPVLFTTLVGESTSGWIPIVRKSSIDAGLPFRNVSDPLWDWFIRAAKAGRGAVRIDFENRSARREIDALTFPDLVAAAPSSERRWLLDHLTSARAEQLLPTVASQVDAVALKAGLLQIHDFLDASHEQSQSIEGEGVHRSGDYWHAINHRREPDYGNSKYWFRQVGRHPIFGKLASRAHGILVDRESVVARQWEPRLVTSQGWDPFAFVDMCQTAAGSKDEGLIDVTKRIQMTEMQLLLAQTYLDATGDASIR